MRLIKLRLKNIASLKGEHEIDFSEVITQSPLFAITGETGAGKSTLLNALGLSLYGEIYKKNVTQLDVVTLGEKDGSIDLIFSVKGKYYLADWKARVRKINGEPYSTPQSPMRNLYVLEKPEFASAKNFANFSTSQLLNLDFEQFCKCVILNQGEFAKFLTSSFNDRKDILEKLYPGELLERMGRELKLELDSLQRNKSELEIEFSTRRGEGLSGEALEEQKVCLTAELYKVQASHDFFHTLIGQVGGLLVSCQSWEGHSSKIPGLTLQIETEILKLKELSGNSELSRQRYLSAVEVQEKELPGLQVFLKSEEALSINLETFNALSQSIKDTQIKINSISSEHHRLQQRLKEQSLKVEACKNKFTFPLNSLMKHRVDAEAFFDLSSQMDLLEEELKGKKVQLLAFKSRTLELELLLETNLGFQCKIPQDVRTQQSALEVKKNSVMAEAEKNQRLETRVQETKNLITAFVDQQKTIELQIKDLSLQTMKLTEDHTLLETMLKLQEVMDATKICLEHAAKNKLKHCPVCKKEASESQWEMLKTQLARHDIDQVRKKFEVCTRDKIRMEEETRSLKNQMQSLSQQIELKQHESQQLQKAISSPEISAVEIETKLSLMKKLVWESENHKVEEIKIRGELIKSLEQVEHYQLEILSLQNKFKPKLAAFEQLVKKINIFFSQGIHPESLAILKNDIRLLRDYQEVETDLQKLSQDCSHLVEKLESVRALEKSLQAQSHVLEQKIQQLRIQLQKGLAGKKASELIESLYQDVKTFSKACSVTDQQLKKQELELKDLQGRLEHIQAQAEEYKNRFRAGLLSIQHILNTSSEVIALLIDLQHLTPDVVATAEVITPIKKSLELLGQTHQGQLGKLRENLAINNSRLLDFQKHKSLLQALEKKISDIDAKLSRKERLYEVLGKDELRTFVLSLVEENLIQQTNEELKKLCQGRYEIIHQSRRMKITPEFFILDKYREGGIRKVSTLSGGETFMVSLAMALGLAELTRGQAEIDSLFIDEGFGSLDQESLEDVLNMLQQIQTRGLMVGIISHIKPLTDSLPINLLLTKRQDGTSSISTRYN